MIYWLCLPRIQKGRMQSIFFFSWKDKKAYTELGLTGRNVTHCRLGLNQIHTIFILAALLDDTVVLWDCSASLTPSDVFTDLYTLIYRGSVSGIVRLMFFTSEFVSAGLVLSQSQLSSVKWWRVLGTTLLFNSSAVFATLQGGFEVW
jgi:hypothetical protein